MEKLPLDNLNGKNVKTISLKNNIKSPLILKKVFSFLYENREYEILKHNKNYQNFFSINIDSYKKLSGRYKKDGINGFGQEFLLGNDNLIFEGDYLNGKRNGKGKEYSNWGNGLMFEGEYLNGKRNGKGKEYYYNKLLIEGEYLKGERAQEKNENSRSYFYLNKKVEYEGEYLNGKRNGQGKEYYLYGDLKFEGEYRNGNRWNGKGYDPSNNVLYELKNGTGTIKEYYGDGKLKFEGEYLNGEKNGKGKEYLYYYGPLEFDYKPNYSDGPSYSNDRYGYYGFFHIYTFNSFEGEYKNGKRNGKGKEFYSNKKIKFEGEYLDGKRWKGKGYDPEGNLEFGMENGKGYIKEYFSDGKIKYEGKYVNGVKHGFFEEYNIEYREMEFWQCETVENREFYYLEFEGQYINGERNGKGKVNNIQNKLEFEGEYLNGKRNGNGKIYFSDGDLKFEGEYINGKIKYGKEYIDKDKLEFEGKYLNGEKITGKIYEYYKDGKLKFEGDYLNGKKWNGKGYNKNKKIIYELKDGKGYIKEFSTINDDLVFEGEYIDGEKNGKCKEYNYDNKLEFKGEYLNGKRWNGIEYNYRFEGGLKYIIEYKEGKRGESVECIGTKKDEYEQEILNDEKLKKEEKEKEEKEKIDIKLNTEEVKETSKEEKDKNDSDDKSKDEKNKIPNFIRQYGKEVGLPSLSLNDKNICSLTFDGKINIEIIYNEKRSLCSFVSPICSIPNKNKETFYKKLLIANSFGIENGGAVLSIDKKINSIILSFTFIVSTFSFELFKTVLLNFVTMAEKNMAKYEKLQNQS